MKKTYELFTGEDLEIAELIQQRRYQMLVHSCIYYVMSCSVVSDKQWDEWARELQKLQTEYPDISQQITLYEYFKDWDASTGEFLPIKEPWVLDLANRVLKLSNQVSKVASKVSFTPKLANKVSKSENKVSKRRLF